MHRPNKSHKKFKNKNIIAMFAIVLMLIVGIMAVSINWQGLLPGGGGTGGGSGIETPPAYGELGNATGGAAGIGAVEAGHTPTGTALNNSNINTFRDLPSGSGGNYYLSEDITAYVGFAYNNKSFNGTLDGNGHTIFVNSKGNPATKEVVGGIVSVLDGGGTIKNLNVVYNTSLSGFFNGGGADALLGAGLVVGHLKNGTIDNVRVVVKNSITLSCDTAGSQAAIGGFAGVVGGAGATQTIKRCMLQLDGDFVLSSTTWHWAGGAVGHMGYPNAGTGNLIVQNYVLTGPGKLESKGAGTTNMNRCGGIVGGFRGGTIATTGYVKDLWGAGIVGGQESDLSVKDTTTATAADNTNTYMYTTRSLNNGGASADWGTYTQYGTISNDIEGQTIKAVPDFGADGKLLLCVTGFNNQYLDFEGFLDTTSKSFLNGNNAYNKINLPICAFSEITSGKTAKIKILDMVVANSSSSANFMDAIRRGRSVKVEGDVTINNAFSNNVTYRGTILGTDANATITVTGLGTAYDNASFQGGFATELSGGGAMRNLKIVWNVDVTKMSASSSEEGAVGLIAGHANNFEINNVHLTLKSGKTLLTTSAAGKTSTTGGMLGMVDGKFNMTSCSVTIEGGAKIRGGQTGDWIWVGGFVGSVQTKAAVTFDKNVLFGSGTIEGAGTSESKVAGLVGAIRPYGSGDAGPRTMSVSNFIFAFDGTMNGDSGWTARVLNHFKYAGQLTLNGSGFYSIDSIPAAGRTYADVGGQTDFVTNNLTNKNTIKSKVMQDNGTETALNTALSFDFNTNKLVLTTGAVAVDPDFVWVLEARGNNVVKDTQPIFSTTSSYSLKVDLGTYGTVGLYTKATRRLTLPADLNQYEHGYVSGAYLANQAYASNVDWTAVSSRENSSAMGALSGNKKYYLTENITIAGFGGTGEFTGILDGCGKTITITSDAGAGGGELGGLAAALGTGGVIKNVRVVVQTSVGRNGSASAFGLVVGRLSAGASLQNVKVTFATGCTATIGGGGLVFMGGLVGLTSGTDANPATLTNVTVELNGKLITQSSAQSFLAGVVGSNRNTGGGNVTLNAKQVIFKGVGGLDNQYVDGNAMRRTAGFATNGGFWPASVGKIDYNGYIYGFTGTIVGSSHNVIGVAGDKSGSSATVNNAYVMSDASNLNLPWGEGDLSWGNPTNLTTVDASFNARADLVLGYTVALFDPSAGVSGADKSLVIAAMFEGGKEADYLVARLEITYADQSETATSVPSLANIFTLAPNTNYRNINVHIKASSLTDGTVTLDGNAPFQNGGANTYQDGWLSDNGRVPAGYGVPTGAYRIDSLNALINWIDGNDAGGALLTGTAWSYGYLAADINFDRTPSATRMLAAGRTLDGMGKTINMVATANDLGTSQLAATASPRLDWISGTTGYYADVYGGLVAVNDGAMRNITMRVMKFQMYQQGTTVGRATVYGLFAGLNKGIIENCALINTNGMGLRGRAGSNASIVFGGMAGANRGTIRYATLINDNWLSLDQETARQKVAGGIAGFNDGGTMEYLMLDGAGSFNATAATTPFWGWGIFMGGIVGTTSMDAGLSGSVISNSDSTGGGIDYSKSGRLAQGKFRYVLNHFSGSSFNIIGSNAGSYNGVGIVAGSITGASSSAPTEEYKAKGIYSTKPVSATTWRRQASTAAIAGIDTFFSGGAGAISGTANNNHFSGGYIKSTDADNGAGNVHAADSYHIYWDYWGGSGALRYEFKEAARLGSFGSNKFTGEDTCRIGKIENANMGANALAPENIYVKFVLKKLYADVLKEFSSRGNGNGGRGGTEVTSANFYSGGLPILRGDGEFYLNSDITVNIANKTSADQNFTGYFDGRGHTITVTGRSPEGWSVGGWFCGVLTDQMTSDAQFINTKIVYNADFWRWNSAGDAVSYQLGIITGHMVGTALIDNVSVTMGNGAQLQGTLQNSATWNWNRDSYSEAVTGGLVGQMEGSATMRNISVDFGPSFTVIARGSQSTQYGHAGGRSGGIVGVMMNSSSISNFYVKGNLNAWSYEQGRDRFGAAICARQWGGTTINNFVLDGLIAGTDPNTSSLCQTQDGTISNVFLLNNTKVNNAIPSQGVNTSKVFFGDSFAAMISALNNYTLTPSVTNGTGLVNSENNNMYLSVALLANGDDLFTAKQEVVARNTEMGYFLWEMKSGATTVVNPGSGTLIKTFAENYYDGTSKVPNTNGSVNFATIGMRGAINIINGNKDAKGNAADTVHVGDTISQVYNGSNKTNYSFRPVYYGAGGAGNKNILPLSWGVGGIINNGRIPDIGATPPSYTLAESAGNAGYMYYDGTACCYIKSENVQSGGTVKYTISKAAISGITSDTSASGSWKDRGTVTITVDGARNGAIDQITYSEDGELTWTAKEVAFKDGSASIIITKESIKGGCERFVVRGYSGITIVTTVSPFIRVAVDTSAPVIKWKAGSAPYNKDNKTRILAVDDVSVQDVPNATLLKVTGPEANGFSYTANAGKSELSVTFSGVSGDYTFTVTDALGRKTEFSEYLDFEAPSLTASIPTVTQNGIVAINKPVLNVALTMRDNHDQTQVLWDNLSCKIKNSSGTVLKELNTKNGGLAIGTFDSATGTGNIVLNLPDTNYVDNVNFVFETTDSAGNLTSVTSQSNVFVDTREYVINIKKPITDSTPYSAISYKLNGTTKLAEAGSGDVLNTFKASLFDVITIDFAARTGFTYGGFAVFGGASGTTKIGDVASGVTYTLGVLAVDEHKTGGAVRNILFVSTQELVLEINAQSLSTTPGAASGGNWSDSVADYAGTFPNFANPDVAVFLYNADSAKYDLLSTVITKDNIKTYFDVELRGPTNAAGDIGIIAPVGGVLTFNKVPGDDTKLLEGVYTLTLKFKGEQDVGGAKLKDKYTVKDGTIATTTVTEKGRRTIILTTTLQQLTYNGTIPVFGTANGGADLLSKISVEFDPATFTAESPKTAVDDANIATLRANLNKLTYTLYQGGAQLAQISGGQVPTEAFSFGDVGTYFIRVAIPISGANKFTGVTGSASFGVDIVKAQVQLVAEAQSVVYGNAIATDKYHFVGMVDKDLQAGGTAASATLAQVKAGVLITIPKLSSEYTQVKIVSGNVAAYQNAIMVSGATAKNYSFANTNADLTIVKRNIILKIADQTKIYGNNDPNLAVWDVSATVDNVNNLGYAYRDNYMSFVATGFTRAAGEDAYRWNGSSWDAQLAYQISGILANDNYNVTYEYGALRIERRQLKFNISGDQGLLFEPGIEHNISVSIANSLPKDKMRVGVVYEGDRINIGTFTYQIKVFLDPPPFAIIVDGGDWGDGLFPNYSYAANKDRVSVRIGASILNVVLLPQTIYYGEELSQTAYVLEGLRDPADAARVKVTISADKDTSFIGSNVGNIVATVGFDGAADYTIAIRRGNLTILPKVVNLNWSGKTIVEYNGTEQKSQLGASITTAIADTAMQVVLQYQTSVINAGSYPVTAKLVGDNSECYIIDPADQTRVLVVQQSEQRITVNGNYVYDPGSRNYPTFNADTKVRRGTKEFWMANISVRNLLDVRIRGLNNYIMANDRIPSILIYSITNSTDIGITVANQTINSASFYVEAGTYAVVASLPADGNHYAANYAFTFVVKNTHGELGNLQSSNGSRRNYLETKDIKGSYAANGFNTEVSITDDSKIGYVVGPHNDWVSNRVSQADWNYPANNWVSLKNGTVYRQTGDSRGTSRQAYNLPFSTADGGDGLYGSHDGDWAYTFFNVAVTESMRQRILLGQVSLKLDYRAITWKMYQHTGANLPTDKNKRYNEDVIDDCTLSYFVREVSSEQDLQFDKADASWIGMNDAFNISGEMLKYGSEQGMKPITPNLQVTYQAQGTPFGHAGNSAETVGGNVSATIPISQNSVKGGSAFRIYLVSQTLKSTRTDRLITSNVNKDETVGNKRNHFEFSNIKVSFVDNNAASSVPTVVASTVKDSVTNALKYQFVVEDPDGIDLGSISAIFGGANITPSNGLSIVQKEYANEGISSPIVTKVWLESGVIPPGTNLGNFTVRDYKGNTYNSAPTVPVDNTAPTIGDIKISSIADNFNTALPPDVEKFWFNKKQFVSAAISDTSGIAETGIYYFNSSGVKTSVLSAHASGRLKSNIALGTGLYYLWARDTKGNLNTITFNLLVDETPQEGLEIVMDEKLVKPGQTYDGSWQKGDVVIENTVSKFGESYGRMYYATSDTDFSTTFRTLPKERWLAMDVNLKAGKFILSETIKTAQMKYYAFKYIAGAASAPGVEDNATAYAYLGYIRIDREQPTISATTLAGDASIGSGQWTNKDIVFNIEGTTGLSKGRVEYAPQGYSTPNADWYVPETTGYAISYYNYTTLSYTQNISDQCFQPASAGGTVFHYKAQLTLHGQNVGNRYAFRFKNGAGSFANAMLGIEDDGFRVNIDTTAPEVTSINSSWQPSATSSQIYIRELDSGIATNGVVVFAQKSTGGVGEFLNGNPVYETTGNPAEFLNNRWYFTFSGLWYRVEVTDKAGNKGTKEVKLKIDEKAPTVSIDRTNMYSAQYNAPGANIPLGDKVWAYKNALGEASISFKFTVSGGLSGFMFAYSPMGYTEVEQNWHKEGGKFDVPELVDGVGSYTTTFTFTLVGDRAENYTFRFTSGAQKSVYFDFNAGAAIAYVPEKLADITYHANIDGTAPTIDSIGAEFYYNNQWLPLRDYASYYPGWATGAIKVRVKAAEAGSVTTQTGFHQVVVTEGAANNILVTKEGEYFIFDMTRNLRYLVTASDNAGNLSQWEIAAKRIDIVPPTIAIVAEKTANGVDFVPYVENTATNQTVRLKYTLTRGDSDIKTASILLKQSGKPDQMMTEAQISAGVLLEGDYHGIITLLFKNGAEVVAQKDFQLFIDKTAPTVTVTGLPSEATKTPANIEVKVADLNGSGIRTATIKFMYGNTEQTRDIMAQAVPGTFSFIAEDWRKYTVDVTDNAGNACQYVFAAKVDATLPQNFSASATSNGAPYVAGIWTTKDIVFTFGVTFATVEGQMNYGKIEYRKNGTGEWKTLFQCSAENTGTAPNTYVYTMTGEENASYEFRAATSSGNLSAQTVNFGSIKLDTVTPALTAAGSIGLTPFVPDQTGKGYTWVSGNISIVFGYTVGISGGNLYYEYSSDGKNWTTHYFEEGGVRVVLNKADPAGKMTFTIANEGFYKFKMCSLANESAPAIVDYKEVKRDTQQPQIRLGTQRELTPGNFDNYVLATWTQYNVKIIVTLTFGKSYVDSKLYYSNNNSVTDMTECAGYNPVGAQETAGNWIVTYEMNLTQNQMNNYTFKVVSGAGQYRTEEISRTGGAVRIDKNAPVMEIESVKAISNAGEKPYATLQNGAWVSTGWTNNNIQFIVNVKTYLSGGTLRYFYQGLAGWTSDKISAYGATISGSDANGKYTIRKYSLTLSGEGFAMDNDLKLRVESGAGMLSNTDSDTKAKVNVKIDKNTAKVDENSILRTPQAEVNQFISQPMTISFSVFDGLVNGIASGVKQVDFGKYADGVFVGSALTLNVDKYSFILNDNKEYVIRVTDNAGNIFYRSFKENIDLVKPTIAVFSTNKGELETSAITFGFGGSSVGVSGAKAQYSLDGGATWLDSGDISKEFVFNTLQFHGNLLFRALSGAGVASDNVSVAVYQDLKDYHITLTQKVVNEGNYSANITYVKNGIGTNVAPVMKNGETVIIRINQRAEFPLKTVLINKQNKAFSDVAGVKEFSYTMAAENISIELFFQEIVSAVFDETKLSQNIRVVSGTNNSVRVPFSFDPRPGFEYTVTYKQLKDAYGKDVVGGATSATVPQTLGVYSITFAVTLNQDIYQIDTASQQKQLTVYYFELINNGLIYYAVESAYDLQYIRYYADRGVEFRQIRDLNITADVVTKNGGDWAIGNLGSGAVYNGANYAMKFSKMTMAGTPLVGTIAAGAVVKNLGITYADTIIQVGDGASFAPFAKEVVGSLQNVYANGSFSVVGTNAKVAGIASKIAAGGTLSSAFGGARINLHGVSGSEIVAAGLAIENNGTVKKSYSVGTITGGSNFANGNMLVFQTNNIAYMDTVTVKSMLYSGNSILTSLNTEGGVTVVPYPYLNSVDGGYADNTILAEAANPKGKTVMVKHLIAIALDGLEFVHDKNEYYIPVTNYQQLLNVNNYLWADFRQTADIDCAGQEVVLANTAPFSGSYDGQGFVIKNATIQDSAKLSQGYGMFGVVIGTIKNVNVKELNIVAKNIPQGNVVIGGLVRSLIGGTVQSVSVGGSIVAGVQGGTLTVGGIVGEAVGGKVLDSLSTISITTEKATQFLEAGSVVGKAQGTQVERIYSIAKVDAYFTKRASVGQLIGVISGASGAKPVVDHGYAVEGVTYVNGVGRDYVIGSDLTKVAAADFKFISFDEMMNKTQHADFQINGKHISVTLKALFPFAKGSGVVADPFEISTAEEFKLIGNYLYANYNLLKDIDFAGNFETIGKGMKFTGSLKGVNGGLEAVRELRGLNCALIDQNYGIIQSLSLQVNYKQSVASDLVFGAVANYNYGTIRFAKANGTIEVNVEGVSSAIVGGIVGVNRAEGANVGYVGNSVAEFITIIGGRDVKFGGVIGASYGGNSYKNIVQGRASIIAVRAKVGMLIGANDGDRTQITRETDSLGANKDIFLNLTLNLVALTANDLTNVTL